MVNMKGQKYNLNHIYRQRINTPIVLIGSDGENQMETLPLFEKSLALTGDLEKIPIIRGIDVKFATHANTPGRMQASGWTAVRCQLLIWNGEPIDENIIVQEQAMLHQLGGNPNVFYIPEFNWDYEGGLLAFDELNFRLAISGNVVVAAVDFVVDSISANYFFEIDWVKVTKEEFKDYILEHIYAEM